MSGSVTQNFEKALALHLSDLVTFPDRSWCRPKERHVNQALSDLGLKLVPQTYEELVTRHKPEHMIDLGVSW